MYDVEALRRKIKKEGLESTMEYLLSDDLPETIKEELEKNNIFSRGKIKSLSLLISLAM